MANLIRVKQLDQPDLSGFFVDSISSESGLLLDLAEQAALNIFSSGTVLLTGNQNISGNKTFLNNLNVSGDITVAGTLRYNEIIDTTVTGNISGYTGIFQQVYADNLVYNTGNQTISGIKTFATGVVVSGNLQVSGTGIFNAIDLNSIDSLSLSGVDVTITSGVVALTNRPTVNGTGILLSGEAASLPTTIVYATGNQTISGVKTFANSGIFSLSNTIPLSLPNNPLSIVGSGNTYVQVNIQNRATGTTATSDLVLTANNGTDTTNYINLGINNSGYSDPAFSNGNQFDGYLFVQGGSLDIATTPVNSAIEFHVEGTTADKVIARINCSGLSIITGNIYISGNPVLTGNINLYATATDLANTGSTLVNRIDSLSGTLTGNYSTITNLANTGSNLFNRINSLSGSAVLITGNQNISGIKTFFDSGIFSLSGALPLLLPNNPLSVVGSGNTYVQLNIQNRATGLTASSDLVITANNGTDSTNFINLGINNVGYNDPAFTNGTGLDGYLFIDGGNLDIGTRTPGRAIEFHAGGTIAGSTIAIISQSGLNIVSGNLTVNNSGVLLSGQAVASNGSINSIIRLTQADYNALSPKDPNTFYVIVG